MVKYRVVLVFAWVLIAAVVLGLQIVTAAGGNTLWVSPTGSDANPGTETQPFQTIQKAADRASAGDTVMILPGTYKERVLVSHSGTESAPITFQATERWGVIMTLDSPWLFKSDKVNDAWSAYYITIRGLVFQDTPEGDDGRGFQDSLLFRAAVTAAKGWRIEDCLFQRVGGGVFVRGDEGSVDDVTIARSVFEDVKENSIAANGSNFTGMDEYIMQNFHLQDVIIRRGNRAGHDPGGTTGAQKILLSNNTRIENLTSYDNVGTGVWLDYQNSNYTVTNSTVFGNHGLTDDWQGAGIWTEVNPGPGAITHNLVFSNTGAGIGLLESENVTVSGNLLVDLLDGVEFRNIIERRYFVNNDVITENSFAPRMNGAGVTADSGDFSAVAVQKLTSNVYDPSTLPWVDWDGKICTGADDCQNTALDSGSIAQTVTLPPGFHTIPVYTTSNPAQFQQVDSSSESITLDGAVAGHTPGSTVQIPVFRRNAIQGSGPWTVDVFDLQDRVLSLTLADAAAKTLVESTIPIYMQLTPTYLNVVLTQLDPYAFAASFISVEPVSSTASSQQSQADLLGYWKFDEGTGAAAVDSSANRNDAVLVNATWAQGKQGSAVMLDGSSAYVNVGNHAEMNVGAGDFTSALWLNLSSDPASDLRGVMGFGDDVDGWLWGPIPSRNIISVQLHDRQSDGQMSLEFPAVLTPGQWYYVAVEKHGDQYQVYVNGDPAGVSQTGYADVSNSAGHLYLGYVPWWSGGFFQGLLDQASLYAEALPVDALAQIMNQ